MKAYSVLCWRARPVLLATFLRFLCKSKEGQVVNERPVRDPFRDLLLVICPNI